MEKLIYNDNCPKCDSETNNNTNLCEMLALFGESKDNQNTGRGMIELKKICQNCKYEFTIFMDFYFQPKEISITDDEETKREREIVENQKNERLSAILNGIGEPIVTWEISENFDKKLYYFYMIDDTVLHSNHTSLEEVYKNLIPFLEDIYNYNRDHNINNLESLYISKLYDMYLNKEEEFKRILKLDLSEKEVIELCHTNSTFYEFQID